MNNAILLSCDDYEGLYINGKLVQEGRIPLNEGCSRFQYFIQLSKKYNFNLEEMEEDYLNAADEKKTHDIGCFPDVISKFSGNYTGWHDKMSENKCINCGGTEDLLSALDEKSQPYFVCEDCYTKDFKTCSNCDNLNEMSRCSFWKEIIDDPENMTCGEFKGILI